jgi:hypothetical protein
MMVGFYELVCIRKEAVMIFAQCAQNYFLAAFLLVSSQNILIRSPLIFILGTCTISCLLLIEVQIGSLD